MMATTPIESPDPVYTRPAAGRTAGVERPARDRRLHRLVAPALALIGFGAAIPAAAQAPDPADAARATRIVADPTALAIDVGSSMLLSVIAYDADGNVVNPPIQMRASLDALRIENGRVHALRPGEHAIVATIARDAADYAEPLAVVIPVSVGPPPIARVELDRAPGRLYVGTTLGHSVRAYERDDSRRIDPIVFWSSSDPAIATVDQHGNVTAVGTGQVTIGAGVDGVRATVVHDVVPLPATRLEFVAPPAEARTGDVLEMRVRATDASGQPVDDVPIAWSVASGAGEEVASAAIEAGRFVANEPGRYVITATAASLEVEHTIVVRPRGLEAEAVPLDHGRVQDQHSSGLHVFRGRDGRIRALTGSWLGDGDVLFWDVTNPAEISFSRSIRVDARGVRDIDVSPDARYAVFSREGASNRRNGVVILDVSSPASPRVAAVLDHGVADDAHGVAATDYHVFAVAADRQIVTLDVENIYEPRLAGTFVFPDADVRVRDIHVEEGLAVVAALGHGVAVLDVGNGRWQGSPANPALVAMLPAGSGRVYDAVPYRQEATGARYLFLAVRDTLGTGGEVRILEWPEPAAARQVARYYLPDHELNGIWVEGDRLYAAYGDGGLRVVDVSGELSGDLHAQGREIAAFLPGTEDRHVPNSPLVWQAQTFGEHVFVVDRNSGLWSIGIEPPSP